MQPSTAALYFLPVALLALLHCAATSAPEDQRPLQVAPLAAARRPQSPLALMLRKRSLGLEAAVRGPLSSLYYPESVMEEAAGVGKRGGGDEMWIWMPAHGYIPVPSNQVGDSNQDSYRVANLMRHG